MKDALPAGRHSNGNFHHAVQGITNLQLLGGDLFEQSAHGLFRHIPCQLFRSHRRHHQRRRWRRGFDVRHGLIHGFAQVGFQFRAHHRLRRLIHRLAGSHQFTIQLDGTVGVQPFGHHRQQGVLHHRTALLHQIIGGSGLGRIQQALQFLGIHIYNHVFQDRARHGNGIFRRTVDQGFQQGGLRVTLQVPGHADGQPQGRGQQNAYQRVIQEATFGGQPIDDGVDPLGQQLAEFARQHLLHPVLDRGLQILDKIGAPGGEKPYQQNCRKTNHSHCLSWKVETGRHSSMDLPAAWRDLRALLSQLAFGQIGF